MRICSLELRTDHSLNNAWMRCQDLPAFLNLVEDFHFSAFVHLFSEKQTNNVKSESVKVLSIIAFCVRVGADGACQGPDVSNCTVSGCVSCTVQRVDWP